MAIINFLFGNRAPSGFALDGVVEFEVDLTIEEQHSRSADVTREPVESGGNISDHVILNPETVRLEGFVTDTPAAVFASNIGRTQSAFETLEDAYNSREPLTVVTGRKTYQDMIITSLDMPRNRPSSMQFSIELQHITIVESETAQLPSAEADVQDDVTPRQDAGRQSTQDPDSQTAAAAEEQIEQSSVLFDIFGGP
jgi:hypothetical protein